MKRQMRRSLKKIERKLSQAKTFTTNLMRSNSAYPYNHHSTYVSSTVSKILLILLWLPILSKIISDFPSVFR